MYNSLHTYDDVMGPFSIQLLYPMSESNVYTIKHIAKELQIPISYDGYGERKNVIYWNWQDRTEKVKSEVVGTELEYVVNGRITSISKLQVMQKFHQAFGYSLQIDPLEYQGRIISKSVQNATHDGKIWKAPLDISTFERLVNQNQVFQRYIDTTHRTDPSLRVHYRVPVFNTGRKVIIPLVYLAYVKKQHHFDPKNYRTLIKNKRRIFGEDEILKIGKFVQLMRADYCELDILRDVSSSRIYIVDLNDTPTQTHLGYSQKEFQRGIRLQSRGFLRWLTAFVK